ncbi:response regulator [Micromonospora sp. STR1s_5]|nr:response regulator [Micromonospora sp. STR1s_5]
MNAVRKSVLLVEDDGFLRGDLAEALKTGGFVVVEAQDALEALALIRERGNSLDFLITDYQLGDISGIHVAFEYRFQNPLRPIVFITGHDLPADIRRMSGVAYLRKPFAHESLIAAMRSLKAADSN